MATSTQEWSEQLKMTLDGVVTSVIDNLPGIIGAILLVLAGWLVARLVRLLAVKLLDGLNRFLERILTGRTRLVVLFSNSVSRLFGGILFWVTLFLFVTAALRLAGLEGMAAWLERIVDYLPAILTGGLIILIGYVLASLVRSVTLSAAQSAELADPELISRLAQIITFVTALIVGVSQMGVDVTFVTVILGVSIAALLMGLALAFGFGARTLVSNLLAAHYLRDLVEPGQKIRIGEWEGVVLSISATSVMLDTPEGRLSVPAKMYHEQPVSMIMAGSDHE